MALSDEREWVRVSDEPLSTDALTSWVTRPNCGAVVTFSGIVRESSTTGHDIVALEYDTSEVLARPRIAEVIRAARSRWPAIEAVAIHHRVGRAELGEVTVAVAVSSPHRADAFAAAQFCIDTVKTTVPMWKREHWEGGSVWSQEATPLADVTDS